MHKPCCWRAGGREGRTSCRELRFRSTGGVGGTVAEPPEGVWARAEVEVETGAKAEAGEIPRTTPSVMGLITTQTHTHTHIHTYIYHE